MPDQSQRTEKPTQQRVRKARREGRFAVSKEFAGALQFLAFAACLVWGGAAWLDRLRLVSRRLLASSMTLSLTTANVPALLRDTVVPLFVPLLSVGLGLTVLSLAAQLGTTQMGLAVSKLAPDFSRLNPIGQIRQFPRRNLGGLMQAVLLLPLFGCAVYAVVKSNLSLFLSLPLFGLETGLHHVFGSLQDLLWRAAAVFLLIGALDFFRQHRLYQKDLRMTRQEVRDELKESEGNPQVKGRIRRLQRDLLRRQMMKEVPKATAVIVNPTHFAVAIRYSPESAGAPRVVAKGKNLIALRIRALAVEHQVPIIENPPLAQALYKSARVGDEIPANLYRAVAEVLAYIYRLMNRKLPG